MQASGLGQADDHPHPYPARPGTMEIPEQAQLKNQPKIPARRTHLAELWGHAAGTRSKASGVRVSPPEHGVRSPCWGQHSIRKLGLWADLSWPSAARSLLCLLPGVLRTSLVSTLSLIFPPPCQAWASPLPLPWPCCSCYRGRRPWDLGHTLVQFQVQSFPPGIFGKICNSFRGNGYFKFICTMFC